MWQTHLDTAQDCECFLRLPLSIEGSVAVGDAVPKRGDKRDADAVTYERMEMCDDHDNREAAYCCERDSLPGIS